MVYTPSGKKTCQAHVDFSHALEKESSTGTGTRGMGGRVLHDATDVIAKHAGMGGMGGCTSREQFGVGANSSNFSRLEAKARPGMDSTCCELL